MTKADWLTSFVRSTTPLVVVFAAACAGGPSADAAGEAPSPAAFPGAAPAVIPPPPVPIPTELAEPTCADWSRWDFFASASADLVRACLEAGVDPEVPVNNAPVIFSAAHMATDPGVIGLLTAAGADLNVRVGGGVGGPARRPGYTPLHMAAVSNPTPGVVGALVEAGADINARDNDGATPLHVAWRNPNPAVFRALLRLGADPLARDERGRIADPTSCANWNTEVFARMASLTEVELCVQLGEDVNTRDGDGNAPLHWAVAADRPTAVTTLLEAGADVNVQNNSGATPLHIAATNQSADIVTLLLDAGAEMNAGAGASGTPLLNAISGRMGIGSRYRSRAMSEAPINALLDADADVNAANSAGTTPLVASLDPRRREGTLADLPMRLLALGADPNSRDTEGRTPLHTAAAVEGPAVIRALLEAGADPRTLTNEGGSALHAAAATGSPEVITLLADAGVDPKLLNDSAQAPLHLAVMRSRSNRWWGPSPESPQSPMLLRALALLNAGAEPNARTAEGDTPLHLSVWQRDSMLVSALVEAGANVNARNSRRETPLHVARAHHNLPAVRTLLNLGADPDALDDAGRVADPVCHWGQLGDSFRGWDFLARSPVESVRGCLESGIPLDTRDGSGRTPLAGMVSTLGCCVDSESVIPLLVAAGADVNSRDDSGRTPLQLAFGMSGRVDASILTGVTAALLSAGADPNVRDSLGRTPLQVAPSWALPLLVSTGADLTAQDSASDTPITCESWGTAGFFARATAEVVANCIAGGADVGAVVGRGAGAASPLSAAAASTRAPDVIRVLLQAGADIAARDDFYGYTPLHQAARSGTAEVFRVLLEAGADPDAWATGFNVDRGWGWTPLHLAARSNPDPDVVRALVEAGADLEAPSQESYRPGNTPLHYSGANPNPEVAAALLAAGADVNALAAGGRTPLHEAAANASNPAVIELLVASGGDVNALDHSGETALHSAAWYNPRPEVMTALITAGGDVNARDPDGHDPAGRAANDRTPLFMAVYSGGGFIGGQPMPAEHSASVVEVLVDAGADLEQTDGNGRTPLHAAALSNPAVFPLLLRLGADPNARDADGRTPLDYALGNRSLEGLPEVRRMREAMRRDAGR